MNREPVSRDTITRSLSSRGEEVSNHVASRGEESLNHVTLAGGWDSGAWHSNAANWRSGMVRLVGWYVSEPRTGEREGRESLKI